MISIKNYEIPSTPEEAYRLLLSKKSASVIGGCAFLRMGCKTVDPAIDLKLLQLNSISLHQEYIEIGAYVTFGELERSELLSSEYHELLLRSIQDIVGVQFRNMVTVGATVYSRYGFSDLNTALLAIGGTVHFASGTILKLEDFLEQGLAGKDIVLFLRLNRQVEASHFSALRHSFGDYALLNLAISKRNQRYRIVIGARPQRSKLARKTMAYLDEAKPLPDGRLTAETIAHAASLLSLETTLGSNQLASAAYRRLILPTLFTTLCQEGHIC